MADTTTITLDKITDKKIKAALAASDAHVSDYMDKLRTANSALYVAMQDAYGLAKTFKPVDLVKAAKELGIRLQTNPSAELAAARIVFRNANPSKASAYAVVMSKASSLDIKTDGFAKWVEEKGGLEKIRAADLEVLNKKANDEAQDALDKAKSVLKSVRADKVIVPRPNASQITLPVHKESKQALWLVQETEGGFEILAVQTSKPSIDSMTKRLGNALIDPKSVENFVAVVKPVTPETEKQDAAKDRLAKG